MDTENILDSIQKENEKTRRHMDVVAESLESKIGLPAEGHGVFVEKVDALGTRVDRLETKLDDFIVETRSNFKEVRAAIKFSYAELDRRVSRLESFVQ